MICREHPPAQGQWTFPGGVIQLGETAEQALRREIREECGLEASVGDLFCAVDIIEHDEQGQIRYHYLVLNYLAQVLGGQLRAASDAQEARWLSMEELGEVQLTRSTVQLIPRLRSLLK